MAHKIAIIDYGLGNLGSIKNMLLRLGVETVITGEIETIRSTPKLILPGVGAFDFAMSNLSRLGLVEVLNELVCEKRIPILGICLGMQIMSKHSEEGNMPGLGWLDSETIRFKFDQNNQNLKIPHMGWNDIEIKRESDLLNGFDISARFYFVHSYHMRCHDESDILATAQHGIAFAAAVNRGNVWGTQFHPEKSHKYGMRLMKNFAKLA